MPSTKQILYSVIASEMLTEESFYSFLPKLKKFSTVGLIYVPDNSLSHQPITTKYFLIGRAHKSLLSLLSITKDYNKDWKKCFALSQKLWTRLLRVFITTMTS